MNKLDILAENRNALLLAEAIGWLHDYRKCSDEHLKKMPRTRQAIVYHKRNCGKSIQLYRMQL